MNKTTENQIVIKLDLHADANNIADCSEAILNMMTSHAELKDKEDFKGFSKDVWLAKLIVKGLQDALVDLASKS